MYESIADAELEVERRMSFWNRIPIPWDSIPSWIFGRGWHVPRAGTAHSSDRHGFWKELWRLRKALDIDVEHSGSVDIFDHFGCAPYNDNEVKQARRQQARPILLSISEAASESELARHAILLLAAFDVADASPDEIS